MIALTDYHREDDMAAILDNATTIVVDSFPNLRQSSTIGGVTRTEQSGPVFYRLMASISILEGDDYYPVQEEIMSFNYGVNTFTTTLPGGITYFRGLWPGTPVVQSATGRTITLSGFTPNTLNVARATDYIQFSGDSKVYQIIQNADSSAAGIATITVNTDLIATPTTSTTVTRGADVEFKLQPTSIPPVTTFTAGNGLIYNFAGDFEFAEVR